ncbi:hypothetical protein IAI18_04910 [Acetobacteraceae bacterium H6797]|nr:hypothetical protein [Acetobacteraceae bacterium H6797]
METASRLRALVPLLLLLAAAGCATRPVPPRFAAPPLPDDYRNLVGVYLTPEYERDGRGPAEISAPAEVHTPASASTAFYVRYPVQIEATLYAPAHLGMRCILVENRVGVSSPARFGMIRKPEDEDSCQPRLAFTPYTELMSMADRLRACRAAGETRCRVIDRPGESATP